jgi:hypothetical protein
VQGCAQHALAHLSVVHVNVQEEMHINTWHAKKPDVETAWWFTRVQRTAHNRARDRTVARNAGAEIATAANANSVAIEFFARDDSVECRHP